MVETISFDYAKPAAFACIIHITFKSAIDELSICFDLK